MTQKLTPQQFEPPVGHSDVWGFLGALSRKLSDLVRKIRGDLDNGVTTFPTIDIVEIVNVDAGDFDPGQIRLYKDTDDNDKVYLYTRYGDDLYFKLLTKV